MSRAQLTVEWTWEYSLRGLWPQTDKLTGVTGPFCWVCLYCTLSLAQCDDLEGGYKILYSTTAVWQNYLTSPKMVPFSFNKFFSTRKVIVLHLFFTKKKPKKSKVEWLWEKLNTFLRIPTPKFYFLLLLFNPNPHGQEPYWPILGQIFLYFLGS